MKGSILFLSKHAEAASTRYRILQYLPFLEKLGWQCQYHGVNNNNLKEKVRLLTACRDHDIVIIQRKLFDPITFSFIKRANRKLVFDYDDAIFSNSDGSPSKRRHQRFNKTTRACQLTLAGNQYLATQSNCPDSRVLPTGITLADYPTIKNHRPAPDNQLTLVWIGSQSTQKYLEHHRAILEKIGETFPNITLKIISDFTLQFQHLKTTCIPWSKAAEFDQLLNADIGIAPMTDDPWTRGKCGLKVIQYMACGLPVISSNCGANQTIVQDNVTGFLANDIDDWLNAIDNLHSVKTRQSMGQESRLRAENHYSTDTLSQQLDRYFRDLLIDKN